MNKPTHGGKRKGAGRKKGFRLPPDQKKNSVVKRIPIELESQVDELVFSFRIGKKK